MTQQDIIELRNNLLAEAARLMHTSTEDIMGKTRYQDAVIARHVLMYLYYEYLGYTLNNTGSFFSRCDHSTVIHAHKKVTRALAGESLTKYELSMRHLADELLLLIPAELKEQRGKNVLYRPALVERLALLENEVRELRKIIDERTPVQHENITQR